MLKTIEYVRDVMSDEPEIVRPTASVDEARARMARLKCRHLPVVEEHRVVGIVSSRDVLKPGRTVRDIMSPEPITVDPDDPIEAAASKMAVRQVSALPVVQGGRLVGIVTTYDLLGAFATLLEKRRQSGPDLEAGGTGIRGMPPLNEASRK